MLRSLENYYESQGILSTRFTCRYRGQCSVDCPSFTGPKSAFVSTGYESGDLPRLLFLSLDSGSGEQDDAERLPLAVRQQNEYDRDTLTLHKHKHWYRTHELAWYILRPFNTSLEIEDVKHYFAHANSAKCCMNKKQRKQADKILFRNCQQYLGKELAILSPKILVSQGNEAKFAVSAHMDRTETVFDEFAQTIRLANKPVFWLHTYHPNNWGRFNRQRNFDKKTNLARGWVKYSKMISDFVAR